MTEKAHVFPPKITLAERKFKYTSSDVSTNALNQLSHELHVLPHLHVLDEVNSEALEKVNQLLNSLLCSSVVLVSCLFLLNN